MADLIIKPGITPQAALISVKNRIAQPTPTFHWTDFEAHEHQLAFTAAKTAGFDVVDDLAAGIEKNIREGGTDADWQKQIMPILRDKGWVGRKAVWDEDAGELVMAELATPRRLSIIRDTNMRTSYSAGRWVQMQQTKDDQPYGLYLHGGSAVPRPAHLAVDHTCLPLDDPWWDYWTPPNGWGCTCSMISISARQFARMNGEGLLRTDAPEIKFFDWTNPRTGESVKVPQGIDPGFAYNPGAALLDALRGDGAPTLAHALRRAPISDQRRIALNYLHHRGQQRRHVCGG